MLSTGEMSIKTYKDAKETVELLGRHETSVGELNVNQSLMKIVMQLYAIIQKKFYLSEHLTNRKDAN